MKTIIRLGQYLEILEKIPKSQKYISSKDLGELNYVTPSTVRQDFFYFDTLKGKTKRGYEVESLRKEIVKILGLEKGKKIIIIGAGKIGVALSQYKDFKKLNIEFVAFFDIKDSLIGKEIEGIKVYHLDDLKDFLKFHPEVEIATICVPPDAAQEVADKLIDAGIKALWNFSPTIIKIPDNILIEYEFVGTSLYSLIYAMKKRKD